MANTCTICKHYGLSSKGKSVSAAELYDEDGNVIKIHLCKLHDIDLFKSGQKNFLLRHYVILADVVKTDEKPFLDLLDRTTRKFAHEIY